MQSGTGLGRRGQPWRFTSAPSVVPLSEGCHHPRPDFSGTRERAGSSSRRVLTARSGDPGLLHLAPAPAFLADHQAAVVAASATVVVIPPEVGAFVIAASLVASAIVVPAGAAALTVAAVFVARALVPACATVVAIGLHVIDALPASAAPWPMAHLAAGIILRADSRATVAAFAAVVRV
jgi:hypothetical protein